MFRSHHVGSQVNAEDGDGTQGQWDVDQDEEQEWRDLWDVAGQSVGNGLLQVVKNQASLKQKHGWCIFRLFSPLLSFSCSNLSLIPCF